MSTKPLKIIQIVGARPNFIKVAALHEAFKSDSRIDSMIIHTGQHFDKNMSDIFFEELEMPKPSYYLGISSGSHIQLVANIMLALEPILRNEKPDILLVVGDVSSTLAAALTAKQLDIPVIHVEAGLRSYDDKMPEELNRKLTDHMSDMLFTTEPQAAINLVQEGISDSKIFFVGNCMIDTLQKYLPQAINKNTIENFALVSKSFMLVTMHRPSNVDLKEGLEKIAAILKYLAQHLKIIFPLHPRTRKNFELFGLMEDLSFSKNILFTNPLPYLDFLNLTYHASLVLTDSGGVQEETSFLKVPCLTFRENTERPVTVSHGTNILLGDLNIKSAIDEVMKIVHGDLKIGIIPELWDGNSAKRIKDIILNKY